MTTNKDVQDMADIVNAALLTAGSKTRINVRRHGQNAFTCLEEVSATTFLPTKEPFFCGTKRQAYDVLRSMIRMWEILN